MERHRDTLNLADTSKRLAGGLIDLAVTFGFVLLVGWLTGLGHSEASRVSVYQGVSHSSSSQQSFAVSGWPAIILLLLCFVLFAVMEFVTGKTPGKYVVKTSVVTAHGSRPDFWQLLIRNIARFIDGLLFYLLGLILIASSQRKQRLGDRMGQTYVVND